MKGADVKCPTCGKGLKDVAPDYELSPDSADAFSDLFSDWWGIRGSCTEAHCEAGHGILIEVSRDDKGKAVVSVLAWPEVDHV